MTITKPNAKVHPTELELAEFLSHSLSGENRKRLEGHIASCGECLHKIVLAYDSVRQFNARSDFKKRKDKIMKKINIHLLLAIVSFVLSFTMPQYFLQFLVATLLLGIKWVVDSKTTRMLVMIHEAWKKGNEKEVSETLNRINSRDI